MKYRIIFFVCLLILLQFYISADITNTKNIKSKSLQSEKISSNLKLPDMVGYLGVRAKYAKAGDVLKNVKCFVKNIGNAPTPLNPTVLVHTRVVLSTDKICGLDKAYDGVHFYEDASITAPAAYVVGFILNPGESKTSISLSTLYIPPLTPPGNYYIGVIVDCVNGKSLIKESNETNNHAWVPIKILQD